MKDYSVLRKLASLEVKKEQSASVPKEEEVDDEA
jgi:hypothetical protein